MADVSTTTNPLESMPMGSSSGYSSGTRTSGVTFDPAALAAAMASGVSLASAGGDIDTAIRGIADAAVQRKAGEAQQAAAIQDYAGKVGEATMAATAIETGEAARRAHILSVANINPDDVENAFARAMQDVHTTTTELETQGAEIDRRAAVGLFDNPLEWLVNQVRLPGMVGQYNAVAEQQNRSLEAVKNLQALSSVQIGLSQNMDADAIAAAGRAKAAADASSAQAKLAEVQKDAAGAAARDIATQQAMLQNKFQINLNLAQLTKERYATGEYASEKEAQLAAEQYRLDKVNEYMARIGSSIRYDSAGFKAMPASKREALVERAGTPYIATNFDEAAYIIDAEGSLGKIAEEGDSAAVNWFRGTIQDATAGVKAGQIAHMSTPGAKALKDQDMRDMLLRQRKDVYGAETADMRKASKNNPYKLAYDFYASGLAAGEKTFGSTAFKNNVVTNYIREFGPTSANPAWTTLDEAVMLDKVAQDVASGKLKAGQAAQQISDFYKTANKLQLERTKYPLFGMDELKNYVVTLPADSSFFTSQSRVGGTVDLTNQADVETYLVKDAVGKLRSKQRFEQLIALPPAM